MTLPALGLLSRAVGSSEPEARPEANDEITVNAEDRTLNACTGSGVASAPQTLDRARRRAMLDIAATAAI